MRNTLRVPARNSEVNYIGGKLVLQCFINLFEMLGLFEILQIDTYGMNEDQGLS